MAKWDSALGDPEYWTKNKWIRANSTISKRYKENWGRKGFSSILVQSEKGC